MFVSFIRIKNIKIIRKKKLHYLGKSSIPHQNVIKDDYTSLEEIDNAVKEVGLVHSQLIFGIDYTISNLETGKNSFRGLSLHHIQEGLLNPYQSVRRI